MRNNTRNPLSNTYVRPDLQPFMEPESSYPFLQQPAPGPTLSQTNPVHILLPYFFEIHLNIILPSTPRPSTWSRLSGTRYGVVPPCFVSPMHAAYAYPALSSQQHSREGQIIKILAMQFLQLRIISSFIGTNFSPTAHCYKISPIYFVVTKLQTKIRKTTGTTVLFIFKSTVVTKRK